MTDQQRRFADEYLVDLNARRAYRAAYPDSSPGAVRSNAYRVKKNPEVAEYIRGQLSLQQERLARSRADREREDRERADRERAERERAEKREEEILCEIMNIALGRAPGVSTRDRLRALELLGKHFGMFGGKDALDREEQAARIARLRSPAPAAAGEGAGGLRVIFVNTDGAEA